MKYELKDLIDLNRVNDLLSSFNKATGFVTALLDCDGNILSKSGWRNICVEFHRKNQGTVKNCLFSDTVLARKTDGAKEYKVYKCLNGLVDVAIPIIINGDHIGNIFTGQFFFEKPNRDFFIKQASEYGFDTVSYLAALDEVPVVTEDNVKNVMDFLLNMTKLISDMAIIKNNQKDLIEILETNEKRYKKAQSLGHVGNWEYNIETSLFWGSDEAKRIYGFAVDNIHFNTEEVEKCIPDRIRVHQALIDLKEKNKKYNLQFDIITKDTMQKKTIQSIAELEKDTFGNPIKISGVIIDITDRKKAVDSLIQSEAKYHALIENLPQRIFSKNLNGEFSTCNNHFAKDLNLTPKDLLGKTDFDFYPNELAEKYRKDDMRILESGKTEEIDELYIYAGQESVIHTVKTTMLNEKGQAIGIMGIFWDVTEIKRNETELKKYIDRLEDLVKQRTEELEKKNAELQKFNKLFVDREFRIKELKDRIKELETENKSYK